MSLYKIALSLLAFLIPSLHANVIGSDTQNFNPITNGIDFVTVHSSETLPAGKLNIGAFLHYSVNTLPNYVNELTQSKDNSRDTLLSSDVHFGLGLTKNWDVGISFPAVLKQTVKDDVLKGVFTSNGLTEIRLNTKVKLVGDNSQGVAVVGYLNVPRVKNNPFIGVENKNFYGVELVGDITVSKVALGLNVGYRFRNPSEKIEGVPIEPLDDQYTASVGASYLVPSIRTKFIGEVYSAFAKEATESQTERELSVMELLLGLKHSPKKNWALHFGAGKELMHGTFTPDWRVYTGITWMPGYLWGGKKKVRKRPTKPPIVYEEPEPEPEPELEPEPVAPPPPPPAPVIATDASAFETAPKKLETFVFLGLNFSSGSDRIPISFKKVLEKLAEHLNKGDGFQSLTISGHTDSQGSDEFNMGLSQRRALRVKKVLVDLFKVDGSKITTQGFGESMPIEDNATANGRYKNRRVEFEIRR